MQGMRLTRQISAAAATPRFHDVLWPSIALPLSLECPA